MGCLGWFNLGVGAAFCLVAFGRIWFVLVGVSWRWLVLGGDLLAALVGGSCCCLVSVAG